MAVRVTDGGLVLEVTDPALQALAQAAVEALGDRVTEPGSIPGDLPVSAPLAQVWLAIRDSLEDIRVAAAGGSRDPGGEQEDQAGGARAGPPRKAPRTMTGAAARASPGHPCGRAGLLVTAIPQVEDLPPARWTAPVGYCKCLRYPFV